ncbi:MAG: TolC family protein [Pseudomonadota bacterium]
MTMLICLAGCVVTPLPLDEESEIGPRIKRDLERIDRWNEPVSGPIGLAEAMARAIKYNLDYRLEWSKRVLEETELDIARYDMLPELVASIQTEHRNNFSGSSSRSLTSGRESLESSTSQDRDILSGKLELSWNVLDFGVSYYRARQGANEILIAEEEKRKVIHRLLQNVRTAYWRTVTAVRLSQRLQTVKKDVEQALAENKSVLDRKLDSPLAALTFRRELIDINRQIQELEEQFWIAKIQLASLMNFRNPDDFEILIPKPTTPSLQFTLAQLEDMALRLRPELRQVDYRRRIASEAAHSALIELLPAPRLYVAGNYNDNSFLFENNWLSAGAQVSWNLLRFLSLPALQRKTEAEQQLLDARSMTLSMAVLTQVKVSLAQYLQAMRSYETQQSYAETQLRIDQQVERMLSVNAIGRQTRIREAMNTLLADVRVDIATAELHSAFANVFMSAGLDPALYNLETLTLTELQSKLENAWPAK